ncbi:MAG: hypothetical protein QOF14_1507 [Hyphomicrobiales bacterium]|jgi:hypothetical protein|nr:hypothetical protein [Hyphomicrobiales bacterium]
MAQTPKTPAAPATPPIQFQYIDRPELAEVFADFVSRVQFDGQTMRFEFCVSRVDDQPGGTATGKRYPSCRLVLQPSAAIDLMNKMQQITATLIKAGVLKPQTPAPATAKVPENMA